MRKDLNGFLYEDLPDSEMLQKLNQFKNLLTNFKSFFKGLFDDCTYSIPLVYEIYKRIDQRADYYLYFHSDPERPMKMSQTKEIALLVFWILKYKPLSLPADKSNRLFIQKNCTINEYFAACCLASYAVAMSPRKDIYGYFSRKNIDILVYSFMHRDISKEAMICYFDSLLNIVED
jgi:hypothetical protein